MSWRVVALVYSRKLGSQFRKSVMAYLADKASDGGEGIWCSKGTVARDLEASRSTVFKVIEQFEDEGLLVRIGTRSHRNGKTVEYRIDLAKIEALELVRPTDQSAKSTSPSGGPVRPADQLEADLTSPSDGPVRDTDPDQSVRRTGTSPPGGPKPSVEQSLNRSLRAERAQRDRDFETFWNTYPHRNGAKKGRQAARKKWDRAIKSGIKAADITAAAQAFHRDRQVVEGFAPDPATWLNQARWTDEIEPMQGSVKPPDPYDTPEFKVAMAEVRTIEGPGLSDTQARMAAREVAAGTLTAAEAVAAVRRIHCRDPGWPTWVGNSSEYIQCDWMLKQAKGEQGK